MSAVSAETAPRPWAALRRSPYALAAPPLLACYALMLLGFTLAAAYGSPEEGPSVYHGLFVYDAWWYENLAESGYSGVPEDGIRFFPLLPLLGRWLAPFVGGVDPALTIICGIAALVFLAQLILLVREEIERGALATDSSAAWRAAWIAALAPGAFVLAIAYTEPLSGALAVGFFRALRRNRPGGRPGLAAMALGVLSGLLRPTGVLLAVPALIEMARHLPRSWRDVWTLDFWGRVGTVASPAVGTAIFLAWSWIALNDALLPYTMQTRGGLRGGTAVNPFVHLFVSSPFGLWWPLQVGLLVVAIALLWVTARRLPASYTAWAALTVAAAISSERGHSFPRYVAGVFPLAIALSLITSRWWRFALVLAGCVAFGLHIAYMSFDISYVP